MKRTAIYLDTSVVSAYFDERAPERRWMTREFWGSRLSAFEASISELVDQEVAETPTRERREAMNELIRAFPRLRLSEEADRLAEEYIRRGIFPPKHVADALHVAVAVVAGNSYLLSWNYKHLVRVATRREVNLVNLLAGWGTIEIVAPPEI